MCIVSLRARMRWQGLFLVAVMKTRRFMNPTAPVLPSQADVSDEGDLAESDVALLNPCVAT